MRFIGCALAWRPGEARDKLSCLVVIDERGSIVANAFAGSIEEVAGAIDGYADERRGVLVGLDAPLAIPNERGTRRIERILSKVSLPAYSANRNMFGDEPYAEKLLEALTGERVEYTDYPFQKQARPAHGGRGGLSRDTQDPRPGTFERDASDNGDLAQKLRSLEDPKLRKGNKEALGRRR